MTLREQLMALASIIADEVERNSGLRRRLAEALSPMRLEVHVAQEEKAREHKPRVEKMAGADGSRKGGRRSPAAIDPLALARQSEELLRHNLLELDIEQLKDVVAEYGMDPGKLVMKWKDSARIVDRIVELSIARSTKGDAFRAEKPAAGDAGD